MAEKKFVRRVGGSRKLHDPTVDSLRVLTLGVGVATPTTGAQLAGMLGDTTDYANSGNLARSAGMTTRKWVTAFAGICAGHASDVAGSVVSGVSGLYGGAAAGSATVVAFFAPKVGVGADHTLASQDQKLDIACLTTTTVPYDMYLRGCDCPTTTADTGGGDFEVYSGDSGQPDTLSVSAGDIRLYCGNGIAGPAQAGTGKASYGGDVDLQAGDSEVSASVGSGTVNSKGGNVWLQGGEGKAVGIGATGDGGDVNVYTGQRDPAKGGADGALICRVKETTRVPSIVPYTNNAGGLGSSTAQWGGAHINNVTGTGVSLSSSGTISFNATGNGTKGQLWMDTASGVASISLGATAPDQRELVHETYGGHWQELYDTTTATVNQTTITFSSLDGDEHRHYMLEGQIHCVSGTPYFYLKLNNLTTNMRTTFCACTETAVSASVSTLWRVAIATSTGMTLTFRAFINARTGKLRSGIAHSGGGNTNTGTTNNCHHTYGSRWSDTTTNITTIALTSSVASGIGVGSNFRLYRMGRGA